MIDTKKLLEEVRKNQAKLEACDGHEFSVPLNRLTKERLEAPSLFCDWECVHCGGVVDGPSKRWYDRGLAHGRKAASEDSPARDE